MSFPFRDFGKWCGSWLRQLADELSTSTPGKQITLLYYAGGLLGLLASVMLAVWGVSRYLPVPQAGSNGGAAVPTAERSDLPQSNQITETASPIASENINTLLDDNNCPLAGLKSVHIVIFDRSGGISGQQKQRILQIMEHLKYTTPMAERLDFYTLLEGHIGDSLLPLARLCRPPRSEEINVLLKNPHAAHRHWQQNYSVPYDRLVEQLLTSTEMRQYPIIESLRAAIITSFGTLIRSKTTLKLTLVSSMMQNSDFLVINSEQLRSRSTYAMKAWPRVHPNLDRVEVRIIRVPRPTDVEGDFEGFWRDLIWRSGGSLVSFQTIW